MKNNIGVIIGRFQPLHDAHIKLIQEAVASSGTVVILVGSSNRSRTFKNPLSFKERSHLIHNALLSLKLDCDIRIMPLDDFPYNDAAWVSGIHNSVNSVVESLSLENTRPNITVYGHRKDDSSYYLNLFPNWNVELVPSYGNISATDIRCDVYNGRSIQNAPSNVVHYFTDFINNSDEGQRILNEYKFITDYKSKFTDVLPYPPMFVTTDAVIYYKGYVLMVRRRGYPGQGQWALPGGFVEENMRIKDSMIKEVKEETRIRVSASILFGNLRKIETFDDPGRSLRGRTITHCGLIILDPVTSIQTLPQVRGGDDADFAKWVSISEMESMKTNIFEDHYFIIKQMLNMS